MTLKEIAKLANVSVSTVSRIINSPDDSFGSQKVRDRVWKAVRQTGYVPNQNARSLRKGATTVSSGVIAVLHENNSFYTQLARVAEQQIMEMGYSVRFCKSGENISDTDGAVILGKVKATHKNAVYAGMDSKPENFDKVISGGYGGALDALAHLIHYGHTEIAYLGEVENSECYSAYVKTMKKQNLKLKRHRINRRVDKMLELLTSGATLPTAVFCADDMLAVDLLEGLKKVKIKVPYPVSVIGMGNIDASGYTMPMLTTVGIPILEMGSVAVQILISRIKKRHSLPLTISLPHKLIYRDSVVNLQGGLYI